MPRRLDFLSSCARLPLLPRALSALLLVSATFGCQRPAASIATTAASTSSENANIKPADDQPPPAPAENEPLEVTWEELDLGMPPDSVYEPWMLTSRAKWLEGRQVRITGFMCGAIFQKDNIKTFPLMREKECPFGPGGQAHHVIEVELAGKHRTSFTSEPITVEGVFSVRPWTGPNGKTWSLYHLEGAKVE